MPFVRRILIVCLTAAWLVAFAAVAFAQSSPAPEPSAFFSAGEIERAAAFRGRAYFLGFTSLGVGLVVIVLIGMGRGSRGLAAWARRRFRRRLPRLVALTAVASTIPAVATLPFAVGRHQHARAYGLATNTPDAFARDLALSLGIQIVIASIAFIVILGLAHRLPRAWPVVAAPAAAGLVFVMSFLYPVVIEPAFNDFAQADEVTTERVREIADQMSLQVDEVLVADASRRTSGLNAYVSGFGATRRVVLFDTLVEESPPREVDVVVAHELAHELDGHVLQGTLIGAGAAAAGVVLLWLLLSWERLRRWLGADAPGDPAVIPFVLAVVAVAALLVTPAGAAISRSFETDADRTALTVTGDPEAMIDLQVRLATTNLADLDPHPFIRWAFFTHPPTMERIGFALAAQEPAGGS